MSEKIALDDLVKVIEEQSKSSAHFVIALSGFGGSGKSTVANKLSNELGNSTIIHVDDFITGRLSTRSEDWLGVEWDRLVSEVLLPAAEGQDTVLYGVYDWTENQVVQKKSASLQKYIIVEGVGLIKEELQRYFDISIWLDVSLDAASDRGKKRDVEEYGAVENKQMWDDIWIPNDSDYFKKHRPDVKADYILEVE